MSDYSTLDWSVEDHILTLTLARPEQLNAFTVEMADELVDAYERASLDDGVGAVVVTGAGRTFCAGMDLQQGRDGNVFGLDESLDPTPADLVEHFEDERIVRGVRDTGGRVSLAVYACRKPVIGAINGSAVGIGATMTLPMDVRLASTKARIGFVFGRLGIVPEAASSWFLPRLVGISRALEWTYAADLLTADEALAGGLLRSVHEPDDLLPAAYELAHRFVDHHSAVGIALTRQLMWRGLGAAHPVEAHLADSLAMFATSRGDGKEGVAAFLEKRPAVFTGRASELPDIFPR
ncbi:MAG: crotonase/enoyl-CoA hydratase family protein [Actinomycetota bacterium]|nr:crotonase/enoyl-CoA hydratase family protein [Actinomycetota bacterium]